MLVRNISRFFPVAYWFNPKLTARSLLHSSSKVHRSHHHDETAIDYRGLDLLKKVEDEEEDEDTCLYPYLRNVGISTSERIHTLQAPCDKIVKLIKFGAINKMIAVQYCHYLAELCRTEETEKDINHYVKRTYDLFLYLMRNGKDLTTEAQINLICDVADTSETNCSGVCNQYLIQSDSLRDKFSTGNFSKILSSCYKFELWDLAIKILDKYHDLKVMDLRVFDTLIQAINSSSIKYTDENDLDAKQKLRGSILEHLNKLFDIALRDRTQFITKHNTMFIESLERLDIHVSRNPNIKGSGRCTRCQAHLPMFDNKSIQIINIAIKELLHQRYDAKYFAHSTPADIAKFEDYLSQLHKRDNKPIDIVIDGLNVAYKNTSGVHYKKKSITDDVQTSLRRHNKDALAQMLINTIIRGNLLSFRKVLIIGRTHMYDWPGLMDFLEKHNINHYFSKSESTDDLFQLYAATFSPRTLLMTNDFFRDHLYKLELDKRIALERWIDTHQVWSNNKTLRPVWPTPYQKVPSSCKDSGNFHVPIIDYHQLSTIAEHAPPPHLNSRMTMWICCRTNEDKDVGGTEVEEISDKTEEI